ncbi:MAG: DUF5895 domain-containing protein [Pleurocapsa sp. MO_226.B13]|nr:DUF5895 domain-containing protein [Pleurocapsa sp. MO_226.B13]
MSNYQDFGFSGDEYKGELTTVPYCQFLNASSKNNGIAITPTNAELAQFELIDTWQPIEHEFSDGTNETLLVTQQPRLLILNRSLPLMSNDVETIANSKHKFNSGNYKAFSYVVVWFLDNNNNPISELPFRLKCSGYAGLTFLKNYSYYNNPNSFCKKFLATYKNLTGDRAVDKNDIFYAHGVYQPTLTRQKATSSINGQSSFAVVTSSFLAPTESNFGSLIIKNGSEVSIKIKELIETTKPWLKTESVLPEDNKVEAQQEIKPLKSDEIEANLTTESIPF